MTKFILYLVLTPIIIYSLESVNINIIFKKNKELKARLFYFFLAISIIYLVTQFFYDCLINIKIF